MIGKLLAAVGVVGGSVGVWQAAEAVVAYCERIGHAYADCATAEMQDGEQTPIADGCKALEEQGRQENEERRSPKTLRDETR